MACKAWSANVQQVPFSPAFRDSKIEADNYYTRLLCACRFCLSRYSDHRAKIKPLNRGWCALVFQELAKCFESADKCLNANPEGLTWLRLRLLFTINSQLLVLYYSNFPNMAKLTIFLLGIPPKLCVKPYFGFLTSLSLGHLPRSWLYIS